jgi:hypothetical protein
MKQMSQVDDPATAPNLSQDRRPAEPAAAISDADLDRISGGGGLSGGVVGSRACANGQLGN